LAKARSAIVCFLVLLFIALLAFGIRSLRLSENFSRYSAAKNVEAYYKKSLQANFLQQNTPAVLLKERVEEKFTQIREVFGDRIDSSIIREAAYIDSLTRDSLNVPYTTGLDSYYWLGLTQNYFTKGHFGNQYLNGKSLNTLRFGGLDTNEVSVSLHPKTLVLWTKILNFFFGSSISSAVNLYPPFVFSLALFLFSLLLWHYHSFSLAALSAILISVHPALISRFSYGFSDTDVYQIFFPGLLTFAFYELFQSSNWQDMFRRVFVAVTLTLAFGLYWKAGFLWGSLYFAMIFLADIYFLIFYSKPKKSLKHLLPIQKIRAPLFGGAMLIGLSFIIVLDQSYEYLPSILQLVFQKVMHWHLSDLRAVSTAWPNVYDSVAELNRNTFDTFIDSLGGVILALLVVLGIMSSFKIQNKVPHQTRTTWKFPSFSFPSLNYFLFISLAGGIYLHLRYVRFAHLSVWYACVFSALGILFLPNLLKLIYVRLSTVLPKILRPTLSRSLYLAPAFIIFVVVSTSLFLKAMPQAQSLQVQVNRAWVELLQKADQKLEPNALIISWWDFGYWISYFSQRAIVFDGGSQASDNMHYWVGDFFLESNEEIAIKKASYIKGSRLRALWLLHEDYKYPFISGYQRSLQDSNYHFIDSLHLIKSDLDSLKIAHQSDSSFIYVLTSSDMIKKSQVWGHMGSWNHKLADAQKAVNKLPLNAALNLLNRDFGFEGLEADDIYFKSKIANDQESWIASYPLYLNSTWQPSIRGENGVYRTALNEKISTPQGIGILTNVFFKNKNCQLEVQFPDGTSKLFLPARLFHDKKRKGITLLNDFSSQVNSLKQWDVLLHSTVPQLMIMDTLLTKSLFTELHILEGKNTKHFEAIDAAKDLFGNKIILWKVHMESSQFDNQERIQSFLAAQEENIRNMRKEISKQIFVEPLQKYEPVLNESFNQSEVSGQSNEKIK